MRDVPIQARLNRVFIVNKSRGVREIELKVVPRQSESRSEAYCRRVCDSAVGYVWNQVKYVVGRARKQVAEVYAQTVSRAFRCNCAKVVLGFYFCAAAGANCKL